jgi:SAM-dependent methyltransferase
MQNEVPDKKRLERLAKLAHGEVLDVGCHDVQNPYLKGVVGFDLRRPADIQPNYKRFVEGDCQAIASFFEPKSFDSIIAGELIEHLENPASFLRGCRSILRDDGRLLLTTPNPYHWSYMIGNLLFLRSGITYDHINQIPFRAMVALLSLTGWEILEIKNGSGGMRVWPSTRKHFIPCPKALAWQHLYICVKK